MRLTYVLPRFGADVAGGAEQAARMFAERLVERDHDVTVLTSCASSYASWAPDLPPGRSVEAGVDVWRLPTVARDDATFATTHSRAALRWPTQRAPVLDREWSAAVGPNLPTLTSALDEVRSQTDVLVATPYMFTPVTDALRWATSIVPTLLTAAAHEEPAMVLVSTRESMRRADAFAFYTVEERNLIERLLGRAVVGEVVGIGIDEPQQSEATSRLGLGDRPFLLCLGRTDPGKGVHDLFDFFGELRRRRPELDLQLLFAGDRVSRLSDHPDVVHLGWVDEATRRALLQSCAALVQPSYFESFSLVLCEAWMAKRPVIVNGTNPVLAGQTRRAEGGLSFNGYAEFEAAVEVLTDDAELAREVGSAGRRYVERVYSWEAVLDRYEHLLAMTVDRHHRRWSR